MAKTEIVVSGIKCDSCAWKDMTIPYERFSEYLNRPCPCCRENLLTEEDYAATQTILAYVSTLNEQFKEVPDNGKKKMFRINMNGTGTVSFEEGEPKDVQNLTVDDGSDCKVYFQQKTVGYADYRPGMYYISPYEVFTEKELEQDIVKTDPSL